MIVDAERALHTIDVEEKLRKYGVALEVIPKGMGIFLNPCDAYFHSNQKKRFWSKIAELSPDLSPQGFVDCICEAYFEVSSESISHYFRRCGLTGNVPLESVIENLLQEGLHLSRRWKQYHDEQEKVYTSWRELDECE